MRASPDTTLPRLSTLLRNNSSTSSGSSSPPPSPITPRDAPLSYFDMDSKRRAAPPAPLTTLPSLSSSIPLTRKPSDERRNISALLNGGDSRPNEYEHQNGTNHNNGNGSVPSQGPSTQAPPPPAAHQHPNHPQHHIPSPTHPQPPQHQQHPQQYPQHPHQQQHPPHPSTQQQHQHHPQHPQPNVHHPHPPPPSHVPPPQDHQGRHDPHHPYAPHHAHPHHHHHHPAATPAGGPLNPPPPPMSAPLMPTESLVQSRGYFSPPPSRQSYDYRPPTAPHPDPYGRPDMGRRHTYHPAIYEYPMYDMAGMPIGYHPAFMGMPFDAGLGARAPISRTTKACDACRSRKVRCDAGGMPGSTGTCSRCRESGRICVYTATQKKRGPTPGRPARPQSSSNSANGARRTSLDLIQGPPSLGDRRQSWSAAAGRQVSEGSAPGPHRGSAPSAYPGPPLSAGMAPSAPWPYQYGSYDERDVRHHPYRPRSGPRTAPLVDRDRPSVSGWEPQHGHAPGPPPPSHAAAPAPPPPNGAAAAPHPHEPRQPPLFDSNYSLGPHPASAWPQNPRREYNYPPEYPRRSISPPAAVRLAPLRRD